MNPQPPETVHEMGFPLALCCLATLALIAVVVKRQVGELYDQLRIERRRRTELEELTKKREQQLDGALAKINELTPEAE